MCINVCSHHIAYCLMSVRVGAKIIENFCILWIKIDLNWSPYMKEKAQVFCELKNKINSHKSPSKI